MKYENGRMEEWRKMIMTGDDDMVDREDMHNGWKKNNDRRHVERHDYFPEDNTIDRITISR